MNPIMLHQEKTNDIPPYDLIHLNRAEKWLMRFTMSTVASQVALLNNLDMPLVLHAPGDISFLTLLQFVNNEAVIVFIPFYFCNKHFVFTQLK